MNFNNRICRRAFLGKEGGEGWITVRVFVSNTDSKVFTVGCIINSSGEYTYLPWVQQNLLMEICDKAMTRYWNFGNFFITNYRLNLKYKVATVEFCEICCSCYFCDICCSVFSHRKKNSCYFCDFCEINFRTSRSPS